MIASVMLLAAVLAGIDTVIAPAATLLTLPLIYKALSPFTVGHRHHPVVVSNLAIALVHVVTLTLIAPSLISP